MDDWRTEFRSMVMQEGAGRVDSMTVESILGSEISKERFEGESRTGRKDGWTGKQWEKVEVCFFLFFRRCVHTRDRNNGCVSDLMNKTLTANTSCAHIRAQDARA